MMIRHRLACPVAVGLAAVLLAAVALAVERRAPPPAFSSGQFRGTFYGAPSEALQGERPRLGQPALPPAARAAAAAPAGAAGMGEAAAGSQGNPFTRLISPASLEDEIKRVRLAFDATVTTPSAFRSGEFQNSRLHLNTLAALFAVIVEHQGDVRWKQDAAAARDLFARTAANCRTGSVQVYNEVRLRKDDLEDWVSGSGLADRQASGENDWMVIADRVPLMTYAEALLEGPLKQSTRNAEVIASEAEQVRRTAELLAVVGEILKQEGMPDADDEDYAALCQELIDAGAAVTRALDQADAAAVARGVGAVSQSCSRCHENYR